MSRAPEEMRLDVGWGRLAAWAWPRPGKPKALCLHGWMDNAASFAPLAAHLDDLDLVALEFAGHGHSDHRPAGAQYYYTDYIYDLDAALDALGWDRCGLIGHSLGGGIASAHAAAAPERVDWLVMLDSLGLLAESPNHVTERMRKSLQTVRTPRRHRRVYESVAEAAGTRRRNNPMDEASALLLAERALREGEGGFRWRTDGRLLWTSPMWAAEAQAVSLLNGIQCPVLSISTEPMRRWYGDHLEERFEAIPNLTRAGIEGRHHVHMDDAVSVGKTIRTFLLETGISMDPLSNE